MKEKWPSVDQKGSKRSQIKLALGSCHTQTRAIITLQFVRSSMQYALSRKILQQVVISVNLFRSRCWFVAKRWNFIACSFFFIPILHLFIYLGKWNFKKEEEKNGWCYNTGRELQDTNDDLLNLVFPSRERIWACWRLCFVVVQSRL